MSVETSDLLFEELIAEIGLDNSIPTGIDDGYYDSEGDIQYLEQLLNEGTSFDGSHALLPKEPSPLVSPPPASKPGSYDVTSSNPLFDFNDDYTLCYDNPLFDEEFEDIIGGNDEGDGDLFFWFSSYVITPSCYILTYGGDVLLLPPSPHIG
ncbi:hypothetical protein Tco_0089953 [Tanacetum coccineum]